MSPATAVNNSKHVTRSIIFFVVLVPLFLPQENEFIHSGKNNGVLTKRSTDIRSLVKTLAHEMKQSVERARKDEAFSLFCSLIVFNDFHFLNSQITATHFNKGYCFMTPTNIDVNWGNTFVPIVASNLTIAYFLHLKDQHDPEKAAKQITDVFFVFQNAFLQSLKTSSDQGRDKQPE